MVAQWLAHLPLVLEVPGSIPAFQDQSSLNASQKYCRMHCILQYFRPSLCYHLSLRSLFCLFLGGCFTQVLLYITVKLLAPFFLNLEFYNRIIGELHYKRTILQGIYC